MSSILIPLQIGLLNVVIKRSHIDTVKTLLLSIPSPVKALTTANVLMNTILLFLSADLVLEPYFDAAEDVVFTRVGAVYPDSARIVVRYPPESTTDSALINIFWRQVTAYGDPTWTPGPVANLTRESDWVATVSIGSLWPSTDYECQYAPLCPGFIEIDISPLRYTQRSRGQQISLPRRTDSLPYISRSPIAHRFSLSIPCYFLRYHKLPLQAFQRPTDQRI